MKANFFLMEIVNLSLDDENIDLFISSLLYISN